MENLSAGVLPYARRKTPAGMLALPVEFARTKRAGHFSRLAPQSRPECRIRTPQNRPGCRMRTPRSRPSTKYVPAARPKRVPHRHPGCENRILPQGGEGHGKLETRKQKLEGGGGGRKLETRKQKLEGGGDGAA